MSAALPLTIAWLAAAIMGPLDGRRRVVAWSAVAALAAALVALAVLLALVLGGGEREILVGDWPRGVGITLRADALGALFGLLSSAVLLAALVYELLAGLRSRMFPALVLFLAAGLTGLFLAGDVFNFYVFFELSMIAAYVLASYGEDPRQVGAGFIFAVVNLLGSFLFLIGAAAVYHVTGTLEMSEAAAAMTEVEPSTAALIAVAFFVAFGVKLGLFPFHFWLPAVYTSAEPGVAAMLSGALANIGSYGLLRFGGELLPRELELGATVLIVLGSASILYGALQALSRRSSAEVLAYSAIGQAGYILVALAIGGAAGYAAAILYAVANALNKTLLFLAVEVRGWVVGATFAVGALSVAGVPPTAGFLGKLALFGASIEAGSAVLVALIFAGGGLSFIYMFQIYQHDFWRGERHGPSHGPALRAPVAVLALAVLALGLWPEPLVAVSKEAAEVLAGARS